MERWQIGGHAVEFYRDTHAYLVDGRQLPSVTQIVRWALGDKYGNVNAARLHKAAEAGTLLHESIERYVKTGQMEPPSRELTGFAWLMRQYGARALASEVPLVLSVGGEPVACGRCDLVLALDGDLCGADIKRTSVLDREYVGLQLNLYRIAYRQCYHHEWHRLYGIHLRGFTRRLVEVPIAESLALGYVEEWRRTHEDEEF